MANLNVENEVGIVASNEEVVGENAVGIPNPSHESLPESNSGEHDYTRASAAIVPHSPLNVRLPQRTPTNFSNNLTTDSRSAHSIPPEEHGNYINFKAALEFVPKQYDGHNIPISKFIRDCLFARDSIKPSERPLLLRFIRSRLSGNADSYVQDKEIYSLEDLLNSLKLAFSPQQNLGQLQTILSNASQMREETIINFGVRVSKNLKQLIEVIEQQFSEEVAYGMVRAARDTALESFLRGLDATLEMKVRMKNPRTLQEGINVAQGMQLEIDLKETLHRQANSNNPGPSSSGHRYNPYRGKSQVLSVQESTKITCFKCNKPGHYAKDCKKKENFQTSKVCYVCGKAGHVARDCSQRKQNHVTCFKCGQAGHYANQCSSRDPLPSTQFCNRCKKSGHNYDNCKHRDERDNEAIVHLND